MNFVWCLAALSCLLVLVLVGECLVVLRNVIFRGSGAVGMSPPSIEAGLMTLFGLFACVVPLSSEGAEPGREPVGESGDG